MSAATSEARFGQEEGYAGPAVVSLSDVDLEVTVEADLRGHFQPIDGHFHWYGRLAHSPDLADAVRPGATVTLSTEHGTARGRLSDLDPWGRFRITGTGTPPY